MVNRKKMKELGSHWKDVMDLAEQYGFISSDVGEEAMTLAVKHAKGKKTRKEKEGLNGKN